MENLRLIKLLDIDDYEIFEDIFREFEKEPFFEKWSDIEVLEEFKEYLISGKIFCYDNNGLMNIQFNKRKNEALPYDDWGNFIYLSDVVVKEDSRNQGIGSNLFDYLIDYAKTENYNSIYFRTNLIGSMSESLGEKRGFELVKSNSGKIITDKVSFLRQNGVVEADIRKYLVKKL